MKLKVFLAGISLSTFFIILIGCKDIPRNKSHPEISYHNIEKGKVLAARYCNSCHALPDPGLLDTYTWEKGVLPAMGPRLGIFSWNFVRYPTNRRDRNLSPNFYPKKSLLQPEEWKYILDYYMASSPDTLIANDSAAPAIKNDLVNFAVKTPLLTNDQPATCMLKIVESRSGNSLFMSDAIQQKLYRLNNKFVKLDSTKTSGPVLDVAIDDSNWISCDIGLLNPNNGKFGSARKIIFNSKGKLTQSTDPIFNELARPVQIEGVDLNNDGKTDYVVCEFGFQEGALSWMENRGSGKFTKHILRDLPGASKVYLEDVDHDGLKDIWALFAQGDEGVFLFSNKGDGKFNQKQVLRFPPAYGSSYFEFADFNKDGYSDIVYTCGDNADDSPVLKPYHGVYIFINDGKNNFTQKYFFHINGCYKAIARDYDQDGDVDIATIAFFADFQSHPEEGFVYLENKGNMTFSPYSTSETNVGRWLTMEAGDINGDGKIDLILGNFSVAPSNVKPVVNWKKGPVFMVLENTGKKHF